MSDNPTDNSDLNSKSKIKAHCFPEIETDKIEKQRDSKGSIENFQSKHFDGGTDKDETQPWPKQSPDASQDEIEQLLTQARNSGYELGFQEGRNHEMKRVDGLADTISKAVLEVEDYKAQLLQQAEKSIVKLVLAIAHKIILDEPSLNSDIILSVAKNALTMVVNPSYLKIKANPKDLDTLNENKDFLENLAGKSSTIQIEPDNAVLSGGCIVQTDFGDIDARLESQMQTIETMLNNELRLSIQKKAT